jgi:hypothetical protein
MEKETQTRIEGMGSTNIVWATKESLEKRENYTDKERSMAVLGGLDARPPTVVIPRKLGGG